MAQHDYNIANDTAANVRADLNSVLEAIVTNNSGDTEPTVTYAKQWWYDSINDILKIRNEADTGWIDVLTVDQTNSRVEFSTVYATNISDGTDTVATDYVVNGSAKATFRYDQSVPSILSSHNVSSISDDATGEYTVTFTAAFTSVDTQRISGAVIGGTGRVLGGKGSGNTASSLAVRTTSNAATSDTDNTSTAAVHGDLA